MYCILMWFALSTEEERRRLQGLTTAQRIIGFPFPPLKDIYTPQCLSRVEEIVQVHSTQHFTSVAFRLALQVHQNPVKQAKGQLLPPSCIRLNLHTY